MDPVEENKKAVLPGPGSLMVSSSPHIHDNITVAKIMGRVLLCLLPCCASAIWFFGWRALSILLACTAFCILFEYLWNRLMKQPTTIGDLSAAVTGVILALNMPPSVSLGICAVGSFIAIVIAKGVFGGLGQNPFNPAAVARVALLIGFAGPMTLNYLPDPGNFFADAVTTATPLTQANMAAGNLEAMENVGLVTADFFYGNMPGALGETSVLAILIGAAGLLCFRLIRWEIPASILITITVFTGIVHSADPALTPGPLFHLTTGAAMVGAFFMATDMVTCPLTFRGSILFGCGIGILTCVIRIWGAYPEGMSFSILIMNALVPLIDRICYRRPLGWIPHRVGGLR